MFALGAFLARVGAPAQATANTTSTTKREGKERPAKLLRKTILTEGSEGSFAVYTGTFQVPDEGDDLGVRIGFMDSIKVMVPVRGPKSYSMSAKRPGEFDITFKHYPGGVCSPYLHSIKVGEEINVYRVGERTRHPGTFVGVVAFGVGITAALPIACEELEKGDAEKVVLLWSSRTMQDTFWADRVAEMKSKFGTDRFEMVYILSREEREGALHGRVSPQVFKDVFDGAFGTAEDAPHASLRGDVRFISIGTKPMMAVADRIWGEIGYPMSKHALLKKPARK